MRVCVHVWEWKAGGGRLSKEEKGSQMKKNIATYVKDTRVNYPRLMPVE